MAAKYFESKFTEKGTELPILNLQGKAYLQIKDRILWFREVYPTGIIKTQLLHHQDETAIFKAEIYIPDEKTGQPMLVSTGHKMETKSGFPDYLEKSESGSCGRALALLGFGTQATNDLDEGMRLADAPVPVPEMSSLKVKVTQNDASVNVPPLNVPAMAVPRPSFRKKAEAAAIVATIDEDGM